MELDHSGSLPQSIHEDTHKLARSPDSQLMLPQRAMLNANSRRLCLASEVTDLTASAQQWYFAVV